MICWTYHFRCLTIPKLNAFEVPQNEQTSYCYTIHVNAITISIPVEILQACEALTSGQVYRAATLLGFSVLMRLSNTAPHAIATYDFFRNLTGEYIFFIKKFVKVMMKYGRRQYRSGIGPMCDSSKVS